MSAEQKRNACSNRRLLFPTSTRKFVAQWQGPYKVVRRTGKVNYKIELPDKGGRKQIFHINHLRKWHDRSCTVNVVIEDEEEMEECQWTNKDQSPQFGNQLSKERKEEINQLSPIQVQDVEITIMPALSCCSQIRKAKFSIPQRPPPQSLTS